MWNFLNYKIYVIAYHHSHAYKASSPSSLTMSKEWSFTSFYFYFPIWSPNFYSSMRILLIVVNIRVLVSSNFTHNGVVTSFLIFCPFSQPSSPLGLARMKRPEVGHPLCGHLDPMMLNQEVPYYVNIIRILWFYPPFYIFSIWCI